MQRRIFLQRTGVLGAGLMLNGFSAYAASGFPVVRRPQSSRHFTSKAVEEVIAMFKQKVANPELGWLFENCFPNTLDTTVFHEVKAGVPDKRGEWATDHTAMQPGVHERKWEVDSL